MSATTANPLDIQEQVARIERAQEETRKFVAEQAKTLGAPIALTGFVRLALGEGVDKTKDDFAGEVAALTGQ